MADISLRVSHFEPPLPMLSDGCVSIDLCATIPSCASDEPIIVSKDTFYLHGTPEEIHKFGQAIVAATEDLVGKPKPYIEERDDEAVEVEVTE